MAWPSCILREKSLAIYFGDSQFRRNRIFDIIISKIYVDKLLRAPRGFGDLGRMAISFQGAGEHW